MSNPLHRLRWEEKVAVPGKEADHAGRTAAAPARPTKHRRHVENAAAKSRRNAAQSESRCRTALVLGGGAPNMALMAGALAGLHDRGVTFDVVSCSGAGSLAGLLWLAPKEATPAEALRSVTTMSVADAIYSRFPVNYKVFQKPGSLADLWRQAMAANPFFALNAKDYEQSSAYALAVDSMLLWAATLSPSGLHAGSWGLCQPTPFVEQIIDFARIKHIKPYFYLNAYNASKEIIDDFTKEEITLEHFHAALAFPFIYGPYRLNGDLYYEGAVVDCLNFKDLVEKHTGLETIVVFDVLGSDSLIRAPRNLYDSWVLSMIVPLVKTAEDNLELFALKHNKGWRRADGARTDLLKIKFDIPDEYLAEVLDWSASNAKRLFDIGYKSGLSFYAANADKLGARRSPTDRGAPVRGPGRGG
ncbi:MAG: patatin-like phospholipase family protein [Xanthobacteraceae bacterium]